MTIACDRYHPLYLSTILVTLLCSGCTNETQVTDRQATDRPAATQQTHAVESDTTTLRVAVAQIPVTLDIEANAATIGRAIDRAIDQKADILLTPEGSLSGYTHQFDQPRVEQALDALVEKAAGAGLALALGTCFVESGGELGGELGDAPNDAQCYNQIRFYDTDGTFLGFHSKTLTCGSMTDPPQGEITHYAVAPLKTFTIKGVKVGGLICNDMWANPSCTPQPDTHLSQQLADMGASVVFHAVNGGRDGGAWSREVFWPFHESNLRIRAQAGKLWIVTADNCSPTNIPCSAPSGVLNPDGNWAVQLPDTGEQLAVYTIRL